MFRQVCEENKCQEEVFLLALSYMDRFLTTTSVRKTHLQILAAACLLLASKLREPSCLGLPAELLVFYTDNSITRTDLIVSTYIQAGIRHSAMVVLFSQATRYSRMRRIAFKHKSSMISTHTHMRPTL